jgi:uncharacterized membrane protein YfcA
MTEYLLLAGAGLVAGAMNATAGGGSFVTLPALLAAGVPPVRANASSTVALVPGGAASAWMLRRDLGDMHGVSMRTLALVSVIGGVLGAWLLLATPEKAFDALIPWLLLLGSLSFAFGRSWGEKIRRHVRIGPAAVLLLQLALGTYGGYFGGGVGVLMMASWTLFGATDAKRINAAKTLLVTSTNSTAALWFVVAGVVRWRETLVVLGAGLLGGIAGATFVRSMNEKHLRRGISVLNFVITLAFFARAFAR